jgi:hypothetical protein
MLIFSTYVKYPAYRTLSNMLPQNTCSTLIAVPACANSILLSKSSAFLVKGLSKLQCPIASIFLCSSSMLLD